MDRYLCLFLFLFLTLFVEMRGGRDECMTSSGCGDQGPLIQFPFRLKDQPRHCGYPGFELSCTENNQTMLELPVSVKLLVKNITYKSREIFVQDPYNCLAGQLGNLNLAAFPFPFKFEKGFVTFFNCSSDKTNQSSYFQSIPCLSIPGNPVYAVDSSELVRYLDLSSCRRLYNASVPGNQDYGDYRFDGSAFSIKWSNSKICRLKKSNSRETACIKGVSKKIIVTVIFYLYIFYYRDKDSLFGAIFGFFLLMLVIVVPYRVYSSNKVERDNKVKVKKFLEDYEALKPSRYSYADIKRITSQFKDKLGEGGYGTVEELHIRIEEEGDVEIAKKLAIVGLSCIRWCPVDRPSMKIVVQMLEGEGDKLTMPPNPFASTVPTNLSKRWSFSTRVDNNFRTRVK
ncbi:hypothetical protein AAG906_008813 [Vitis piasezkii]